MKRFRYLIIICILFISISLEAQNSIGYRIVRADAYIFHCEMLPNGDVYVRRSIIDEQSFSRPCRMIGNYWGNISAPSSPIKDYWIAAGGGMASLQFCVATENGDIYKRGYVYNQEDTSIFVEPCWYLGNFWEGAVSTDKSSWGEIKGQFKK